MNPIQEIRAALAIFIADLQRILSRLPGGEVTPPSVRLSASASQLSAPGPVEFTVTGSGDIATLEVFRSPGAVRVASLPPGGGTFTETITAGDGVIYVYRAVGRTPGQPEVTDEVSVEVNIPAVELPDTTAPALTLTASPNPVTAAGRVILTADATDNVDVASVTFRRTSPNAMILGTATEPPFTWEDDTPFTPADNGTRSYSATATDGAGNVSKAATASTVVNIPVPADVTAPVMSSFTMPNHPGLNITEAGSVLFRAVASDNVGVKTVLFYWNNIEAKRKNSAPYEVSLDFSAANNGPVQIRARAYDAAGNFTDLVLELNVNIATASPVNPALYVEPDPETIQWGPPVVIDDAYLAARKIVPLTAGLYAGRYPVTLEHPALNLKTGDCAVWVNTTKPILLRHSTWCGVGGGGTGRGAIGNGTYGRPVGNSTYVDVAIEDCTQINPKGMMTDGQTAGGLRFAYPKNVIVRNNNINGSGLLVLELRASGGGTIKYQRNKVRDVDGRIVDRSQPGGYRLGNGKENVKYYQAIQLDKVGSVPGIEISDNDIANRPGESRVEDNINTYKSGGTSDSPLLIYRNLIDGAYAGTPTDGFSGSGVVFGDQGGDNTDVVENTVVRTSNTAISMSSMNYGRILRNKMAQTGFLPNGTRVDADGGNIDVGVYARNYVGDSGFVMDKTTNIVDGNMCSWGAPLEGKPDRQLNYGFSSNATAGPNGNGTYGIADDALIERLIADHRAVWAATGVVVGRRNP